MLNFIMLSVANEPFMLNVVMLNVFMLSVIILNVVAPFHYLAMRLLSHKIQFISDLNFYIIDHNLCFCRTTMVGIIIEKKVKNVLHLAFKIIFMLNSFSF
jgi:hypothetical protein